MFIIKTTDDLQQVIGLYGGLPLLVRVDGHPVVLNNDYQVRRELRDGQPEQCVIELNTQDEGREKYIMDQTLRQLAHMLNVDPAKRLTDALPRAVRCLQVTIRDGARHTEPCPGVNATHRTAWRKALVDAVNNAKPSCYKDDDPRAYWLEALRAFDEAFGSTEQG